MQKEKKKKFFRPEYGQTVQSKNFYEPFVWNRENKYDWTIEESIQKEIEMESMWREYFTQKGDKKQSNISYWRAVALKKRITQSTNQ